MHGGDEVALLDGHRQVDGIEVRAAVEAAAQVRARVDRRVKLLAARTEERKLSLAQLVGPLQLLEQHRPGDLVAQAA